MQIKTLDDLQEEKGFGPVPPKAKEEKPKPKRAPSQRGLTNDIAALLIQANLMLAPVLRDDVMDDVEILALAKAVDDQAKKSPRFRKALMRMVEMSGGSGLFSITLIIVGRRAARHGMISPDWDAKLGAYLAFSQMTPQAMMEQMEAAMMAAVSQQTAAPEYTNGQVYSDDDAAPEPGPIATPIRPTD